MERFVKSLLILATFLQENAGLRLDNDGFNPAHRRQMMGQPMGVVLGAPTSPEHLPEGEPLLPGHSLIRPALGMLKSAVKYPHKEFEDGGGVYGGQNSVGIGYEGKNDRLTYSDFRRSFHENSPYAPDIDETVPVFVSAMDLDPRLADVLRKVEDQHQRRNNDFRRAERKKKEKVFRDNPGNPYTVYKNRYLRNYLWNLAMTGDHMNINPLAPEFTGTMPGDMQGVRKWWYFNQDDYRPFSRR